MRADPLQDAQAQGEAWLCGPLPESARYDAWRGRIIVRLTTGGVGFPPALAVELEHAIMVNLAVIEVDAFGFGGHVPALDADLYPSACCRAS